MGTRRRTRTSDSDYALLLAVRSRLRRFEHWSANQAGTQGLTSSQHQLLLAVRGHDCDDGPTIGDVAEYLMVRHNTAVELVNRTQELGLLERRRDDGDHRVVRLGLTEEGRSRLAALAGAHIEELSRLRPMLEAALDDLDGATVRR